MTERGRRAAIPILSFLVLVTACNASTPAPAPTAATRAPTAAATYSPTEFTGNRSCAGIALTNIQLQILPDGTTLAIPFPPPTPELRSAPMTIVWPPGYTLSEPSAGRQISSPDGTKVYRDGSVIQELGVCPYPDRRMLVWDPPR